MENLPIVTKFCGESIGPDSVRTVFAGEEDFGQNGQEQKSIILIGTEKSEIIDAFCNIFYGITFDSAIRYKIANERFDASIKDFSIVKYVFYGTKFSFIPVIFDIPDIQSQSSSYTFLQKFLTYDINAQIHALAYILPGNIPSFSPQIQIEFTKLLSLFSPILKESSLAITNNNTENDTNSSNTLLQQIKIIPLKRFYTNTSSLFVKPSLDATIRERQMRYFDLTVQNLSLLIFHLGILSPQAITNLTVLNQQQRSDTVPHPPPPPQGLPPRPRPASAAQNRIPSTIHENVSIASTSSKSDIPVIQLRSSSRKLERPTGVVDGKVSHVQTFSQHQGRPSSFQETEDRIQISKSKTTKDCYSSEQTLAPQRSVIYGSQPIGTGVIVPEMQHGDDPNAYIHNKRYLYDPETRTYQMYYVHEKYASQTLPPAVVSASPIPRVISPAHGVRKNEVREEMARLIRGSVEDIEGTPTESSEQSSGIIQRGGIESARSTSSDWKYTPSNRGTIDKLQKQQQKVSAPTFISGSPEPPMVKHALTIPSQVRGFSYADPRMSWKQGPPKPARAVDPEFGKSEEEESNFQRVPLRQTRRQISTSQRRAIKSHPQQGSEIYSEYPEWDDTDEVEYAENVPLRKFQPNQEIYQQKVPVKQGWGQQTNTKRFSYPPPIQQQQQQPRNPYQQIPSRRPSNMKRIRGPQQQQQPPPGYRRRPKQTTFEIEESSSERGFDCTKCCFYILAPIFIISAIIAVVVTLILSAR